MLVTFTASTDLPQGKLDVVIPSWRGAHIQIVEGYTTPDLRSLIVRIDADGLGTDLLLATLLSPAGVVGVAVSPNNTQAVPLKAYGEEPWFAWASAWTSPDPRHQQQILIRNETELPVALDTIAYMSGNTQAVQALSKTIKPWDSIVVRFKHGDNTSLSSPLLLTKRTIRFLPSTYNKAKFFSSQRRHR